MKGKAALVTGSSKGLGRAILLRLAEQGANVVVNYFRDEAPALEVQKAAEAEGAQAIAFHADVSRVDEIQRLFDEATAEFGEIDIVVANAGMEKVNVPFTDVTEEDFDLLGNDPIEVTGHVLATDRLNVSGWYSGVSQDSEDTLNFSVLKGVRPIIETFPLEEAEQVFQNQSKVNIRPVLVTS